MSFHEVRFPTKLSFGSVGGPERRTDVVTLEYTLGAFAPALRRWAWHVLAG